MNNVHRDFERDGYAFRLQVQGDSGSIELHLYDNVTDRDFIHAIGNRQGIAFFYEPEKITSKEIESEISRLIEERNEMKTWEDNLEDRYGSAVKFMTELEL